jgi:hypothetical protein
MDNAEVFPGYCGIIDVYLKSFNGNKQPVSDLNLKVSYLSWLLPCVVPCSMVSDRPGSEMDSPGGGYSEKSIDLVRYWHEYLHSKRLELKDYFRLTLGPGLDAEKVSNTEMIDELIRNVLVAKADKWINWADGGDKLMARLKELKTLLEAHERASKEPEGVVSKLKGLVVGKKKSELPGKLDEALQVVESMKGKGRSEFYTLVRTYLVLLKKRLVT